jgi:hypothetical protein
VESENRIVIMLFLIWWCRNGNLARSARGLDVIIVNPGIIIGPDSKNREAWRLLTVTVLPWEGSSSRLAMW